MHASPPDHPRDARNKKRRTSRMAAFCNNNRMELKKLMEGEAGEDDSHATEPRVVKLWENGVGNGKVVPTDRPPSATIPRNIQQQTLLASPKPEQVTDMTGEPAKGEGDWESVRPTLGIQPSDLFLYRQDWEDIAGEAHRCNIVGQITRWLKRDRQGNGEDEGCIMEGIVDAIKKNTDPDNTPEIPGFLFEDSEQQNEERKSKIPKLQVSKSDPDVEIIAEVPRRIVVPAAPMSTLVLIPIEKIIGSNMSISVRQNGMVEGVMVASQGQQDTQVKKGKRKAEDKADGGAGKAGKRGSHLPDLDTITKEMLSGMKNDQRKNMRNKIALKLVRDLCHKRKTGMRDEDKPFIDDAMGAFWLTFEAYEGARPSTPFSATLPHRVTQRKNAEGSAYPELRFGTSKEALMDLLKGDTDPKVRYRHMKDLFAHFAVSAYFDARWKMAVDIRKRLEEDVGKYASLFLGAGEDPTPHTPPTIDGTLTDKACQMP